MAHTWFRLTLQTLALLLLQMQAHATAQVPVGRVALSVGEAVRVSAMGHSEPLRLGLDLAMGDRIITNKDAIALIVFADEGRVSLRANSELVIHSYKIDPSGANTTMHLELVRGVMRQISGQGAKTQPDRYRLNTPIATIGVRGTDFLAKTSGDALETFIQEGTIVVLRNSNDCQSTSAQGNCGAPLAQLSALDAGQYLRLSSIGQIDRRVIGADELEIIFGISVNGMVHAKSARVMVNANGKGALPRPERDNLVATGIASTGVAEAWAGQSNLVASLNQVATSATSKITETGTGTGAGGVIESKPIDLPRQLVWGRFNNASDLPLTIPYQQALQDRHVTVGELGEYALWRANPSGRLDPELRGQMQFALAAGEAVFEQTGGPTSPAQLLRPTLAVDFDRASFAASASLSHQKTGVVDMSVAGKVNDEGLFTGSASGQRVAGALSRNGQEAGYLFTLNHQLGNFRGVTLWKAR